MAPNHDEDILRLVDQITSEREYFSNTQNGNTTDTQTDERKQRLARLSENARKLASATQQPQLAFWDLVRRV